MKNVKRNYLKKVSIILALVLTIIWGMIPEKQTNAASIKVGKPKVSVSFSNDKITIKIGKTDNAEGFRIYVKEPNASKYAKLKTLTQDGKVERSYSFTTTKSGQYIFKVRGYNNSTGKTIWGKYSKAAKISVEVSSKNTSDNVDKDGVNKDLKELLDSYENFLDDYANFMKKYIASAMSLDFFSMMDEYEKMESKLEYYEKKFDSLNPQMMSAADYKYYMAALVRIEKKLLSLYY